MPAILIDVDIGELEERPTNKIPGFYERLTELFPRLYEHRCSVGKPGGFLQRMREGTWMGHVARARRAGAAEPGRGRGRPRQDARRRTSAASTTSSSSYAAGRRRHRRRQAGHTPAQPPDLRHRAGFRLLSASWKKTVIRAGGAARLRPVDRRPSSPRQSGATSPCMRLDPRRSFVQLGHGVYQKRIWATVTSARRTSRSTSPATRS